MPPEVPQNSRLDQLIDQIRRSLARLPRCRAAGCDATANVNGYCAWHAYLADEPPLADDDTPAFGLKPIVLEIEDDSDA